MPNVTTAKHLTRFNKPVHSILNHIPPGKRVRLREDVYKRVKHREWILNKIDSEGVHLLHESKAYGLIVRAEDIDWGEFEGKFVKRNQQAVSERRGFES